MVKTLLKLVRCMLMGACVTGCPSHRQNGNEMLEVEGPHLIEMMIIF